MSVRKNGFTQGRRYRERNAIPLSETILVWIYLFSLHTHLVGGMHFNTYP